ncbi:DNA polymerase IV [Paludibacter sp. 221]|uniref:DNA polymerase IV n=1 Tax=Paludibacter sp. 221 TaxID=2302939 RepID=UPI0013D84880|nr:DNA polymerase IV [Paludibacter sp. 221]NDV47638.1 DNA polymerase IV [Paludibacter sp. 221]
MESRKIIHIDMDAFYASIEQRDYPQYKGKPLAVGYSGDRGVVAAASYEARKYGVHSAMASKTAKRKCPHLIFLPARFGVYKEVSRQIRDIFFDYTDLVEPLSLDEAFLDVTNNHKQIASATQIAQEIKERIYQETSLTASAGVSFNKFLAKIASDQNKPDGLYVIRPRDAEDFLAKLPIERFFGVGKVTAEKMHRMGVNTGADLRTKSEAELVNAFGKAGHVYYLNVRAIDERAVEPNRIRKSIGAENTFATDIGTYGELEGILKELSEDVFNKVSKNSFTGRTVTIKIKYADFKVISRSKTLSKTIDKQEVLFDTGRELLHNVDISPTVRLLGISVKKPDSDEWKEGLQLEIDFENC